MINKFVANFHKRTAGLIFESPAVERHFVLLNLPHGLYSSVFNKLGKEDRCPSSSHARILGRGYLFCNPRL